MIIEFIPEKCWCNTTEYKLVISDTYKDNTKYVLGKCVKCETIRTISSSANNHVEYNDTVTYSEELGVRHINSLKTIVRNIRKGSLLDIGCSRGNIIDEIRKKRTDVLPEGIDLNSSAIENPVSPNISIKYLDIVEVQKKYNNIIALHVLEHIPDLETFFNEVKRISEDDVTYYFVSPNINSYRAKYELNKWGALNPNQHSWHFSKETFSAMLLHFLPGSKVKVCKSSWVWPFKKLFYRNILFQGDQVEVVITKN